MVDLVETDTFRERLHGARRARRIVEGYFGADGPQDEMHELIADALDEERVADRYLAAGERLAPHVVDGQAMVDAALGAGEHVLLEGQLGTMRDIDWGVYPYVTSSSPIPGGASLGAGLPAVAIDRVLGVAKAYTTAVGAGPLPTELDDATASGCASAAPSTAPPPGGRGAAAGMTRSRSATRCGWPATRPSP